MSCTENYPDGVTKTGQDYKAGRTHKQAEMWTGRGQRAGPGSGKVKSGGWVAY